MSKVKMGVIENNGAFVHSPDPADSPSPGATYARIITLRHNGDSNGDMLVTFDLTTLYNDLQAWPIYRSSDGGVTWRHVTNMFGSDTGFPLQMNPMLFEVPIQLGDLAPGTLLLAGNLKPADESTTNIIIFYSTDQGDTWSYLSTVDTGGPAVYDPSPESTTTSVWEPFLAVSNSGELVCYYSDERQKDNGVLQALVQKISSDGGKTWGEMTNVVAVGNRSDRPGMITMTTLPDGNRLITYEVVNRPSLQSDGAQIYFKTSPDGVTWDAQDLGQPILLDDGRGIGSSPYVIWVNDGTENGMVVVGGKWALDSEGNLRQGQNFYINRNLGNGYWDRLPMAVSFDSLDDAAYLTGLSQSMEISFDGSTLYQAVNVENEETRLNDIRVGALPIRMDNYEAENASLNNIRIVEHYDASNDEKVGDINFDDSRVRFETVQVDNDGTYTMNIRYDNGSGADCIHWLTVNGGEPQLITYPPTKNWGRFLWKSVQIVLVQGANTIELGYYQGYAEIDCMQISG